MKRQFIKVSKELEQAKMAPTDTQINYKEIFSAKNLLINLGEVLTLVVQGSWMFLEYGGSDLFS